MMTNEQQPDVSNFVLQRIGGSGGEHADQLVDITTGEKVTCMFWWREIAREISEDEVPLFPTKIRFIVTRLVESFAGEGNLQIRGYTRSQSLEIIRAVLMQAPFADRDCWGRQGLYAYAHNKAITADFGANIINWARQEFVQLDSCT